MDAEDERAKKPNITIIVLDALRVDMFNELIKTRGKELSRLGHFLYLKKCIAPETWTLPSFASILTGTYASEHGAHETKTVKALNIDQIMLKRTTMISDLKEMGYKTYAVSASPYFHPVYGFVEFDDFKEESYFTDIWGSVIEVSKKLKPLFAKYREKYGSKGDLFTSAVKIPLATLREDPALFLEGLVSGIALTPVSAAKKLKAKVIDEWPLEKGGKRMVKEVERKRYKRPFFLFINLLEPHDPYTESKKEALDWRTQYTKGAVTAKKVRLWKKLYAKASRKGYAYAYEMLKHIIAKFGDNQIIIFTSDHGQAFNEHGFVGHGAMLYDEIVRVPFALMLPKGFNMVESRDYSSLINIKPFLFAAISGDKDAARLLYSKKVIAESFGTHVRISSMEGIDRKKLSEANRYRKRVFVSR
jgi:arylsulfatase A-like enzyme